MENSIDLTPVSPLAFTSQDGTNQQRREEREKNLQIASDLRRQADEKSGAERDALELKAQTFFQKVRYRQRPIKGQGHVGQCVECPFFRDVVDDGPGYCCTTINQILARTSSVGGYGV